MLQLWFYIILLFGPEIVTGDIFSWQKLKYSIDNWKYLSKKPNNPSGRTFPVKLTYVQVGQAL